MNEASPQECTVNCYYPATLLSFQPCSMDVEWALANNYRALPNNKLRSVNNRSFGGGWAYLSLFFHPISEPCTTDRFSRAFLKSCIVSKCWTFSISWLHRGQRGNSLKRLVKEDGESVWWVLVGYRTLIRNDGISDLFKKESDGILAQKVATMAY